MRWTLPTPSLLLSTLILLSTSTRFALVSGVSIAVARPAEPTSQDTVERRSDASVSFDFDLPAPIPVSRVPLATRDVDMEETEAGSYDNDESLTLEKRSTVLSPAVAILVPAYIYPSSWSSPPAWQPLYDAAQAYPKVTFHVVVNPNSGPGGASPDSEYQTAITTLKKFSNVVLLGYVHTSWTKRSSDLVYWDINLYAGWSAQGFGMDGIFFDEAPTSATPALYNYMANITCHAKTVISPHSTAALSNAGGLATVYFNPGAVADVRYYVQADYIAIFEDTYANYLSNAATFAPGTEIPMTRSNLMIHGMQTDWTTAQMSSFVSSLANGDRVGSVFLTSSADASNPYGSFSADWAAFVAGVAALAP